MDTKIITAQRHANATKQGDKVSRRFMVWNTIAMYKDVVVRADGIEDWRQGD
jgi:hypothetical protein